MREGKKEGGDKKEERKERLISGEREGHRKDGYHVFCGSAPHV